MTFALTSKSSPNTRSGLSPRNGRSWRVASFFGLRARELEVLLVDAQAQVVLDGGAQRLDEVLLERGEHVLLERAQVALLRPSPRRWSPVVARRLVLRVVGGRGEQERRRVARRREQVLQARGLGRRPLVDLRDERGQQLARPQEERAVAGGRATSGIHSASRPMRSSPSLTVRSASSSFIVVLFVSRHTESESTVRRENESVSEPVSRHSATWSAARMSSLWSSKRRLASSFVDAAATRAAAAHDAQDVRQRLADHARAARERRLDRLEQLGARRERLEHALRERQRHREVERHERVHQHRETGAR